MKLLIIFNPNAAYGRSVKKLPAVEAKFESLGMKVTFIPTTHTGHGTELVTRTDLSTYDGLVAAGGDGTVFEVLNGLYQHPKAERIPLGLLPIGTGNAFARELNLKTDTLMDAIELIHRGHTRKVDVGLVESTGRSFYFVNIVAMGFAVDAGLVAQKMKFMGKAAYTLATLWKVLKLKSYPLELEIDGESFTSDNIFVTFSNSRYTGTHFLMAPEAKIDDGQLDVTILESLPRTRLLKLFPTIYDGRHIEYPEVKTYKAAHIIIRSPQGMLLGPDGEFRGNTPAEITCLPRDLTIFS
ncbi:MAG: diacylglycerol kinase family lipid kinase [Xanthomonadales bacterium]|nr:diacylglycerol kinase family lipid kinase [Xanthomonadales bacterium]MDH4019899.1 diacylglycerol kinase family lipid kinase [Xanthomonadales bacterium]